MIKERTNAGLQSARTGGRPKGYTTESISKLLRSIYKDPTRRLENIKKSLGLTKTTFAGMIKFVIIILMKK